MCHKCFHQILVICFHQISALVKPVKGKKAKIILHDFIKIVNESKRKPNKLWVDQEKEFYNNPMQKYFDDNDILIYSIYNKSTSIVAERFIRTFNSKIYQKTTVNNSKCYLSYLNKLVDEYNNTYHRSIWIWK